VIRTKDSQLLSDLLPTETETIDENELNSYSEHSNVSSDEIVSNSEFSSNNGESLKRKMSETSDDTKKTKIVSESSVDISQIRSIVESTIDKKFQEFSSQLFNMFTNLQSQSAVSNPIVENSSITMKLRNSGSIKEQLQTCSFLKLYETDESKELKQFADILLEKSLNLKYG